MAAAALLLGGIGAASAATQVIEKNPGGLIGFGPVSGDNGFPAWYEDSSHTRVELCLDDTNPLCGFLPGDIPDDSVPIHFPENFPSEAFYALASAQLTSGAFKATLTLGLEAAFANAVQTGDQQVFGRQRLVVRSGPPNSTLTFQEPYGTLTVDTDATGAGRIVEDISPAIGNFATPLKGNVGPFLHWDTGAPAGYLGDPAVAHTVTGSPLRNDFSVTGGGLNLSTTLFNVQGKISTNSGVSADAAVVNGNMIDVFASSGNTAQLQVEGVGLTTTPMVTDPGSGRFYARVAFSGGTPPASVKVVNIADKPASNSSVTVSNPSGIVIHQASYDGSNLTVAATSSTYPLHVVGVPGADLTDSSAKSFPVTAPSSTITVRNDAGGSVTVPLVITGGPASPGALPPITPAPDPGPVTTGGGTGTPPPPATTTKAVATIAQASLSRGLGTQLDGTGSTNAGTGALTYAWSQVGGPKVAMSDAAAAKPTVSVPFFTKTSDTQPVPADGANPAVLRLKVTDSAGTTSTADVKLTVVDDSVVIAAGARHRIGTELRVTGTATLAGNTAILVPGTSVVIYDITNPNAPKKLGNAPVDTLNAFDLRLKPGPSTQVTNVLVQSTRGGSAKGTLASK